MLSMVILVGLGERMTERFLPIYLLALGGGVLSVGILNGLNNLLSALYSFPGGYLSDRLGIKRALLIFNVMAISGYLIVILVPSWVSVIIGSVLFLSWSAISLPATMSLVAEVLPRTKRTMGVSMHSLVRRVPMALGPVLGGLFIVRWGEIIGVRLAFIAALVMAVVAAIVQQILIKDTQKEKNPQHLPQPNPFRLFRELGLPIRHLLVSDILVRFCEQIPYAFVVIWTMKTINHPVSAVQFGFLTTIEMTTAMLVYIPVAYLADKSRKKPFVVITFAIFTCFPLFLMISRSFGLLAIAFIVRGLKEFGEPTRKALIMDLAPEGRKAAVFGLYYLVRDVFVSLAAFGGAFLWQRSPYLNFTIAAIFGFLGTLWFAFRGKDISVKNSTIVAEVLGR
jgi:MFS family permease